MDGFHPLVARWFTGTFGSPSPIQREGWSAIRTGGHALLAAPTGSGKTLAAFLVCIDDLVRRWESQDLSPGVQVLYLSPLRALSNDIEKNLAAPLEGVAAEFEKEGREAPAIRTAVRTGDTSSSARQAIARKPPHILVTTPESLYLMLTSPKARGVLSSVRTLIVDEIHALARDKRGSHLTLSVERLEALTGKPLQRIGLSATQRPLSRIAEFLVGVESISAAGTSSVPCATAGSSSRESGQEFTTGRDLQVPDSFPIATCVAPPAVTCTAGQASRGTQVVADLPTCGEETPSYQVRPCRIVDLGHSREMTLEVETPMEELSAVCSGDQWELVYERLCELILTHRSTLVFVNTRRMAERIAHHLSESLGKESVCSHHGSLSKEMRLEAETRLKNGELKAIVATASLELGIDVGYVDLVCQIGSPRSIAVLLQRVGRSGHSLGQRPHGKLFPLTRDELIECMALVRGAKRGALDTIEIPHLPIDILAQQIVAMTASEDWDEDALYGVVRRAAPFRDLDRATFDKTMEMLEAGITRSNKQTSYVYRDRIGGRVKAKPGARLRALVNGGAIPEMADYRVLLEDEETVVGSIDEHFAVDSQIGSVFLLGSSSWRIVRMKGSDVVVRDAEGAPPDVPFWEGEAPGRTFELSEEISSLREDLEQALLRYGADPVRADGSVEGHRYDDVRGQSDRGADAFAPRRYGPVYRELEQTCGVSRKAARFALKYVAAQQAAVGVVPSMKRIVFERFFDESGGMQLVIHAPFGMRINRAWGLALRKRFCRSFDFELQAAADENGVLLSLSPQHSFPVENLFKLVDTSNCKYLLEQALLAAPMFQVRWRWNATRALGIVRREKGRRVPPHLQRYRAEDLLAAVFPEQTGCFENHHGDREIPDHLLVHQTIRDCLVEAMDIDRWTALLSRMESGEVELLARETREPSPFSHGLINANPYSFLDPADKEQRRTRAVSVRRTLSVEDFRDLARLDPAAIDLVRREAEADPATADALHEALLGWIVWPERAAARWRTSFDRLTEQGRATRIVLPDGDAFWLAAENQDYAQALYPDGVLSPPMPLPERLKREPREAHELRVEVIRGRMPHEGPTTAARLAEAYGFTPSSVFASLEALESEGVVLRGAYTEQSSRPAVEPSGEPRNAANADPTVAVEWCDRRLLARIHRLTLEGLRSRVQPVEPDDFLWYLTRRMHVEPETQVRGEEGLRHALQQLQGFEVAAGAWEPWLLASRLEDYRAERLDAMFLAGELVWGKLRCPASLSAAVEPGAVEPPKSFTRAMPIAICFRESLLAWLSPERREERLENGCPPVTIPSLADAEERSRAEAVREQAFAALQKYGALFAQEIATLVGVAAPDLRDRLRELVGQGRITADSFESLRSLVGEKSKGRKSRFRSRSAPAGPAGRWSAFPGRFLATSAPVAENDRLERWCRQLLDRYGVVFRELLAREAAAPAWRELVPIFRRLEMRGEIRGGRFVRGVSGEQYALEGVVEELRALRERRSPKINSLDRACLVSAADPLNLLGIVLPGNRLPSSTSNRLLLYEGRLIGRKKGDKIELRSSLPAELKEHAAYLLKYARRKPVDPPPPMLRRAARPVPPAAGGPGWDFWKGKR
ncbi:MAG TPA: DEAD/DEAH box helicase [Pirellulaceae bacterium]|jgi:ATP-dependent Lhr-like helicase|nr:DEAD/DEAH box helicase [Pirellulaceae bacterium]